MKVIYFSGTGNSFFAAKQIAKECRGELVNIFALVPHQCIDKKVVIVSPMHHHGIPRYVKKWISNLERKPNQEFHYLLTYGFNYGQTDREIIDLFKKNNLQLMGCYPIQMPYNYVVPTKLFGLFSSFKLKEYNKQEIEEILHEASNKVTRVANLINEKSFTVVLRNDKTFKESFLHNSLHKKAWLKITDYSGEVPNTFDEAISLMDHAFKKNSECISCGQCQRVCPVNNIVLDDKGPMWKHNCEQCFACLQWCPKQAIQFRDNTQEQPRYHHPDVTLKELF